jgi:hypothetical protein
MMLALLLPSDSLAGKPVLLVRSLQLLPVLMLPALLGLPLVQLLEALRPLLALQCGLLLPPTLPVSGGSVLTRLGVIDCLGANMVARTMPDTAAAA